MRAEEPSIKSQLLSAAIGWGVPTLCSSSTLLIYVDAVSNFFRSILGWRLITALIAILVFGLSRFIILWLMERKANRALTQKLSENFRNYLKPVSGKGYCIDVRFNEPICPKCAMQEKESFMRFCPARFTYAHDILMCDICKHIVLLDTCAAKIPTEQTT